MNVLWIQNHHRTPHNHFFTCPSGADLWLVSNALGYSKCACLKRTIKQKLEGRSQRDSRREIGRRETHTESCFWKGMCTTAPSLKKQGEMARFLLKFSEPQMPFLGGPKVRIFQCNIFSLLSKQAWKIQRQGKLHLQCTMKQIQILIQRINFDLKRLICHLQLY